MNNANFKYSLSTCFFVRASSTVDSAKKIPPDKNEFITLVAYTSKTKLSYKKLTRINHDKKSIFYGIDIQMFYYRFLEGRPL